MLGKITHAFNKKHLCVPDLFRRKWCQLNITDRAARVGADVFHDARLANCTRSIEEVLEKIKVIFMGTYKCADTP